jgi:hypothetical protein
MNMNEDSTVGVKILNIVGLVVTIFDTRGVLITATEQNITDADDVRLEMNFFQFK